MKIQFTKSFKAKSLTKSYPLTGFYYQMVRLDTSEDLTTDNDSIYKLYKNSFTNFQSIDTLIKDDTCKVSFNPKANPYNYYDHILLFAIDNLRYDSITELYEEINAAELKSDNYTTLESYKIALSQLAASIYFDSSELDLTNVNIIDLGYKPTCSLILTNSGDNQVNHYQSDNLDKVNYYSSSKTDKFINKKSGIYAIDENLVGIETNGRFNILQSGIITL
jgi:hypothetical protein